MQRVTRSSAQSFPPTQFLPGQALHLYNPSTRTVMLCSIFPTKNIIKSSGPNTLPLEMHRVTCGAMLDRSQAAHADHAPYQPLGDDIISTNWDFAHQKRHS